MNTMKVQTTKLQNNYTAICSLSKKTCTSNVFIVSDAEPI